MSEPKHVQFNAMGFSPWLMCRSSVFIYSLENSHNKIGKTKIGKTNFRFLKFLIHQFTLKSYRHLTILNQSH